MKVSVIVPVFNTVDFLPACIESLQRQTFENHEIILIDDGSTDHSLDICYKFEKSDGRINVIHQENQGQSAARNRGLEAATGDLIMFVDSDDTISQDTISSNLQYFIQNPELDFVQFPLYQKYGTPEASVRNIPSGYYSKGSDFISLALQDNVISWIVCDKIFSKNILKGRKFREDIKFEDNYFMVELLPELHDVMISQTGLYYYFHRENSTTTSKISLLKEKSTLDVLLLQLTLLENQPINMQKEYLIRIINVAKSLKSNFNYRDAKVEMLKKQLDIIPYLKANVTVTELLKMLQFKYL